MPSTIRQTLVSVVLSLSGCARGAQEDPSPTGGGSSGGDGSTTAATSSTSDTTPTTTEPGSSSDAGSTSEATSSTGEPGSSTGSTGLTSEPDTTTTGGASNCGDGLVEGAEACDDGNLEGGDGCGPACERDGLFVFVSSQAFEVAALKGLATADDLCTAMAQTGAAVPVVARNSKWVAWLSDGITSAQDRIGTTVLPYRRLDLTLVAENTAELLGQNGLDAPISVDQFGDSVAEDPGACGSDAVWTGTDALGEASTDHCEQWTSSELATTATVGSAHAVDATWTQDAVCFCAAALRLYCFEVG